MDLVSLYSSLYRPLQRITNEYIHLDIEDDTVDGLFIYRMFCMKLSISMKLFKKYAHSIFVEACKEGSLNIVSDLMNISNAKNIFSYETYIRNYTDATNGNIELIKMLFLAVPLEEISPHLQSAVSHKAIEKGNLQMYMWMSDYFRKSGRTFMNDFRISLFAGKLDIAKWIYSKYKIARYDFLTIISCGGFVKICESNCIDTIKWVYEEFKLTKKECFLDEIISQYNGVYRKCNVEIIKWLHSTFKPNREKVLCFRGLLYRSACIGNNWEVVKYMREELNITHDERKRFIRELLSDINGINISALHDELFAP